jgi:hypothetical protein
VILPEILADDFTGVLVYCCALAGILLTSHYPLYCSACDGIAKLNITAASWIGPEFGGSAGLRCAWPTLLQAFKALKQAFEGVLRILG